jgi:predicted DNA-binding transcriptional regulator YafY
MSWVMGFGRQAEVLEPAHLREALVEELATSAERYTEVPVPVYEEDS